MPDRFIDPYLDPETGVLRNLVCALSYDELENAEGELASSRATELMESGSLCHDAGYDLDWREVSGEENDEASRAAAEDRDYTGLFRIFRHIAKPCDPHAPLFAGGSGGSHLG